MKWKEPNSLPKPRPFLVLPLLESPKSEPEMPPKTNLKLFTKTKKTNDKNNENERPLTATLEKPTILDIRFITKIDMSLMRKEFLSITNLCRIPLKARKKNFDRKLIQPRPLSLPSTQKRKRSKKAETSDDSWEDDSVASARKTPAIIKSPAPTTRDKRHAEKKPPDPNNNNGNKPFGIVKTRGKCGKSTKLPEPCRTCGRPDAPERFHSHPDVRTVIKKKSEPLLKTPTMKSSVQKPVAMKYKSKLTPSPKKKAPVTETKQATNVAPPVVPPVDRPRTRSGKGPRMLTCYLCGREFGTASLPLHEPKCLQVRSPFNLKKLHSNTPVTSLSFC